jgi:hypothetical protein
MKKVRLCKTHSRNRVSPFIKSTSKTCDWCVKRRKYLAKNKAKLKAYYKEYKLRNKSKIKKYFKDVYNKRLKKVNWIAKELYKSGKFNAALFNKIKKLIEKNT